MNREALYTKEIKCPVCGKNFTSTRVRTSAIKVETRDSDFCVHYKGVNPMFYDIYVCPHCGYAALADRFDKIDVEGKKAVLQNTTPNWTSRDYGGERTLEQALECYKLALLCAQLKRDKPSELAALCLRIAWLYRFSQDEQEERRFLQAALDEYVAAYERQTDNNVNEMNLLYIIGELYRRLGNAAQAVQWFSRVVNHKDRENNPLLISMAREGWQSIKEKK
jgi:hypothetical protein